jgi:hypothetical protein
MVPPFSKDDKRYHSYTECKTLIDVFLDRQPTGYTQGVFTGEEGWILAASKTLDISEVHTCPSCHPNLCVEPIFGRVEVKHHW